MPFTIVTWLYDFTIPSPLLASISYLVTCLFCETHLGPWNGLERLPMSASVKAMDKIRQHPNLPVFDDVIAHPEARLPSRSPIWSTVLQPDWSINEAWKEDWLKKEVPNQSLISDPVVCQPGFDLERKDWSLLNRFRTGHGLCASTLHDWSIRDDPLCACGSKQTMSHIVNERVPADQASWWTPGSTLCRGRFCHLASQDHNQF